MDQPRAVLLMLLFLTLIGRNNAAFQCYKCNDCGTSWNPNKAALVLTENGGSYCTKRVVNNQVTKDYSASCTPASGFYCCQSDVCNSSQSKYHFNIAFVFMAISIGLLVRTY